MISEKTPLVYTDFPCLMMSEYNGVVLVAKYDSSEPDIEYQVTVLEGSEIGKSWPTSKKCITEHFKHLPMGLEIKLINAT